MKNPIMQFGYTEKTVKVRKMDMQTLQVLISQIAISEQMTDCEIRIIDTFAGTVETYKDMQTLLCESFALNWYINVYRIRSMFNNVEGRKYLTVVISDDIELGSAADLSEE